jgi:ribosomal protein S18 acetylase RimI-like enzyme
MGQMTNWSLSEALPADWEVALPMLFQSVPVRDRVGVVERTLGLLHRGELPASSIRLARTPTEILGAMLCLPAVGNVGLVWPPQTLRILEKPELEDALVQGSLAWLGRQGIKLCQALLRPEEVALTKPLLRNGFRYVTTLSYLVLQLNRSFSGDAGEPKCHFVPLNQTAPDQFAAALAGTYEGTLDCPELNDVRSIEETLAGHRAQGKFDPARWWLVEEARQAVGVLLINAVADDAAWEIIYMGLAPAARGRGLGRQLLAKAVQEARQARIQKLTLCVDQRNQPALNLYRRAGFETGEQREVFLAVLPVAHK